MICTKYFYCFLFIAMGCGWLDLLDKNLYDFDFNFEFHFEFKLFFFKGNKLKGWNKFKLRFLKKLGHYH